MSRGYMRALLANRDAVTRTDTQPAGADPLPSAHAGVNETAAERIQQLAIPAPVNGGDNPVAGMTTVRTPLRPEAAAIVAELVASSGIRVPSPVIPAMDVTAEIPVARQDNSVPLSQLGPHAAERGRTAALLAHPQQRLERTLERGGTRQDWLDTGYRPLHIDIPPALRETDPAGTIAEGKGWSVIAGAANTPLDLDVQPVRKIWRPGDSAFTPGPLGLRDPAIYIYRAGGDSLDSGLGGPSAMPDPGRFLGSPQAGLDAGRRRAEQVFRSGESPRFAGERLPLPWWASEDFPWGVYASDEGIADFRRYASITVSFERPFDVNRTADFAVANKMFGFRKTPRGLVWHHVEDAHTMQLVPKLLHDAVPHRGGISATRAMTGTRATLAAHLLN